MAANLLKRDRIRATLLSLAIHAFIVCLVVLTLPEKENEERPISVRLVHLEQERAPIVLEKSQVGDLSSVTRRKRAPAQEPNDERKAGKDPDASVSSHRGNGLLKSSVIDLSPGLALPTNGESALAKGPELTIKDGGTYGHNTQAWRAKIRRDGRVELEDKIPLPGVELSDNGLVGVKLSFDLTDLVMQMRGDMVNAPEKRKFLAATKDVRTKMARDTQETDLIQALSQLKPQLNAIWNNDVLSLAAKKQRLFDLWDECAQNGSGDVMRASELIRASIIAFIAAHLPKGSEGAFSVEELKRFNHSRTQETEFNPYS